MNKQKRLFLALNLPINTKERIANKLLTKIPKDKWRTVKSENLHITMRFLGNLPADGVRNIADKIGALKEFDAFGSELQGVGHFKNRVLWTGVGKGGDDLKLLSKKVCSAIEVTEEMFHPHVTLARNKGSSANETDELVEELRGAAFFEKVEIESIELVESVLHKSGPEYKIVSSVEFKSRR